MCLTYVPDWIDGPVSAAAAARRLGGPSRGVLTSVQLDDQRASAALAVLAEVSRTMQVLFFTHHARLVELARATVAEDQLVVHELVSGPYLNEARADPRMRQTCRERVEARS